MRGFLARFFQSKAKAAPVDVTTMAEPMQPAARDPEEQAQRRYLSMMEQRAARRSARAANRAQRARTGIMELIRAAPGRASAESLYSQGMGFRAATDDTRRKWRKALAPTEF